MRPRRPHPLLALVLATIALGVAGSIVAPGSAATIIGGAVGIGTVLGVLLDGGVGTARPPAPPRPAADAITVDLGRRS